MGRKPSSDSSGLFVSSFYHVSVNNVFFGGGFLHPCEVAATLADAIEDARSNVWSTRAAAMDANSLVGWGWTWTVE